MQPLVAVLEQAVVNGYCLETMGFVLGLMELTWTNGHVLETMSIVTGLELETLIVSQRSESICLCFAAGIYVLQSVNKIWREQTPINPRRQIHIDHSAYVTPIVIIWV